MSEVLEAAAANAKNLAHDYVGTEHVLLALIGDVEGIAGRVLAETGVSAAVSSRIAEILRSEAYGKLSHALVGLPEGTSGG